MRNSVLTLAAIALPLVATPAQAETVVLKPSSSWNVDFGEQRCRLTRLFSDGANDHLLYFEQHWPSSGAGLTMAGRSFNRFVSGAKTKLLTADDRAPLDTTPFKGSVERFGDALIYSRINLGFGQISQDIPPTGSVLPSLDPAHAERVDYLSFRQRSREVRFVTGPLGKAFEVLNQCTTSLIGEWGLDVERHKTALRLPRWNNQEAVTQKIMASYPSRARNIGEQGIMRLRVMVNEAGAVTECEIIKATTTKNLESPACKAMQEAQFDPALDASGKPMASYFVTSITYRLN